MFIFNITAVIITASVVLYGCGKQDINTAASQQPAVTTEASSSVKVDKEPVEISKNGVTVTVSSDTGTEPDPPDDTMSSNEAVSSNEVVSENSTPSENAITTSENSLPFEIKMLDTPETKYTKQSVNLRKGPSTSNYAVITTLPINQQVTTDYKVIKYKDSTLEWYHIVYTKKDGTTEDGYISAKYLSDSKTSTASSSKGKSSSSASTGKTPAKTPVQTPAAPVQAPVTYDDGDEDWSNDSSVINSGDLPDSGIGVGNLE